MRNLRFLHRSARSAFHASILTALCALPAPAFGDESQMEMWGCAPVGTRRNILYLADWGSRSYVKIQNQRVPARLQRDDSRRRWDWRGGAVVLLDDGVANYYEGADQENPRGVFRCRPMH